MAAWIAAARCFVALVPAAVVAGGENAGAEASLQADQVPDYAPVRAWNGLGRFVELARFLGISVALVSQDALPLDDPAVALILVYPDAAPDTQALIAYVDAGGRLLLADDYGFGGGALAPLGLVRTAAPTAPSAAFRNDPDLPIALPQVAHPALEGVVAVVANHPAALGVGPGAHCLLEFQALPPACLLAEASRGYGTALALADPSALIDLMLEVEGNRELAEGLLRYLTANRAPRIALALPAAALHAVQPRQADGTGWRATLRRWFAGISEPIAAAPPWVWALLALAGVILAAIPWVRTPTREDTMPPRLLSGEHATPATGWPPPSVPEAYEAFAREAVERMRERIAERRAVVERRLRQAARDGAPLGRRLRLRLERFRLANLEHRLRLVAEDAATVPDVHHLSRLASEFVKASDLPNR